MKLRLSVGKFPLNGYLNIDPCPDFPPQYSDEDFDVKFCDFRNLDPLVFDSECEKMIVENITDYIFGHELDEVVNNWVKKLRHGAEIVITGTDISETLKLYLNGQINCLELNLLLYGTREHPWSSKNGSFSLYDIESCLKFYGLKTISKKLTNNTFTIISKRS